MMKKQQAAMNAAEALAARTKDNENMEEPQPSPPTRKSSVLPATRQPAQRLAKYLPLRLSGNHIGKVLPVPIPNTAVKLSEPMIVHTSVKVGIAGFLKTLCGLGCKGFFYALIQHR